MADGEVRAQDLAQETAGTKLFETSGRVFPGSSRNGFADFRPRHSRLPTGKNLDDGEMSGRTLEKGCE